MGAPPALTRLQYFAYGLGHVQNDACAILWFSYGLFFLHELCNVPAVQAGLVIFAGQIADAIATPLAGIFSDATPPSTLGGRRLVWIVLGSACVVVCFPRFFSPYVAATPVWSAVAASLFNVGWATTQVGHLALAPDLGGGDSTQLLLSAIRQVATVLSSLASFVLVRVSLALLGPSASAEASARVFHQVSLQVVYAGAISTLLCVLLVGGWPPRTPGRAARAPKREARATKSSKQREASASAGAPAAAAQPAGPRAAPRRRRSTAELAVTAAAPLGQWLTKRVFWHVGLLYTCARLSINLTATYMPLLLLEVCKRSVADVASVPILLYLCQILGAIAAERLTRRFTKPRALAALICASAAGSLGLRLLPPSAWIPIVLAVCVQSLASSGVLVLVVAMQADAARLFPHYGHGFLYGTHSMLDKLTSGVAIVLLQQLAQRSEAQGGAQAGATGENGMAAPAGASARQAYVIGACIVPMCAAVAAGALGARDAIVAPWPASEPASRAHTPPRTPPFPLSPKGAPQPPLDLEGRRLADAEQDVDVDVDVLEYDNLDLGEPLLDAQQRAQQPTVGAASAGAQDGAARL